MVSGVLDAALEIAERRAKIQFDMKDALLSMDLAKVLQCACRLTGVDEAQAAMLLSIPQAFTHIPESAGSRLSRLSAMG
jgi:hypothetical protein